MSFYLWKWCKCSHKQKNLKLTQICFFWKLDPDPRLSKKPGPHKSQNSEALEAQNRALESHRHSEWMLGLWRLKMEPQRGQWSQIPITLIRSRTCIRIKVMRVRYPGENPDPHQRMSKGRGKEIFISRLFHEWRSTSLGALCTASILFEVKNNTVTVFGTCLWQYNLN